MAAERVKDKPITAVTKIKAPKSPRAAKIIELATEHPNLTTREIGKLTDCDHSNVVHTLQRYGIDHAHVNQFKNVRADIIAGLQDKFLSSITYEDIQKTPVGTRVLAACQLYDKERLERGQSTSNLASVHADIAALRELDKAKVED